MFDTFTDRARKVMQLARQEAILNNHREVSTGHLLLALVKEGHGVAANVLQDLGVSVANVRATTEALVGSSFNPLNPFPSPRFAAEVEEAIVKAKEEASALNHNWVGTEHLLLGLLKQKETLAQEILARLIVTPEAVRERVLSLLDCLPAVPATPTKRLRVIRVLTYEGPEDWLEKQVGKSIPDGHHDSYPFSTKGTNMPGTITITTVVDERPSQQVTDPAVLKAVEEAKQA